MLWASYGGGATRHTSVYVVCGHKHTRCVYSGPSVDYILIITSWDNPDDTGHGFVEKPAIEALASGRQTRSRSKAIKPQYEKDTHAPSLGFTDNTEVEHLTTPSDANNAGIAAQNGHRDPQAGVAIEERQAIEQTST